MLYVKLLPDKMSSYHVKLRKDELYGVSDEYESLNYDVCENNLLLEEERHEGYNLFLKKRLYRLMCFALIGVITALLGFVVEIGSEVLTIQKYTFVQDYIDSCVPKNCLIIPFLIWAAANTVLVVIGAILVTFVEPKSKGSGVPHVISYLNGIHIPNSLRFRTLVIRVIGVILSTGGGLAVGKEGPMVHTGAIVGAGISQGKTSVFNHDFNFFAYFREDHEKRDFVAGGAAAGVTAAFGAPIGGVLFSLEGCASFINQRLAWQLLFGNLITSFVLNVLLNFYYDHHDLSHRGLLNMGKFDELKYTFAELPVFCIIGIIGGLSGALHNQLALYLKIGRSCIAFRRWLKVTEAGIMAVVSAAVGFVTIYFISDCSSRSLFSSSDNANATITDELILTKMFCEDSKVNAIASIWFQTPQAMLRSILHQPHEALGVVPLIVFGISFYVLATVTYGISTTLGLFIPALVIGATWGRLVGVLAGQYIFRDMSWQYFGKYALLGAAAQLSGVLRLTLSLTVIMIETTGNVDMSLPLIITVVVARWTGDQLNMSVYAKQIQVKHIPHLAAAPPPLSTHIKASQVMKKPAVSLRTVESVGNIVDALMTTKHSGFPVKGPLTSTDVKGKENVFRGLILRSQLITLLESKPFIVAPGTSRLAFSDRMSLNTFRYKYPHYTDIRMVPIDEEDRTNEINLVPYMNNSPYTVYETTSLPRAYTLFRGLGLRHLVVVNDKNEVAGMITRVDLARYRTWNKNCRVGIVEVEVIHHHLMDPSTF